MEEEKNERKKKILHFVTGVESSGGAEAHLLKTLPYLKKTDSVVCAMTGRGDIGRKLKAAGVPVVYLDMKNKFDLRGIFRYRKVLREVRPDLQINYLIHADIFGRIFGKFFGAFKIISYIRNRHEGGLFGALDRFTLPMVDFVLTNSKTNLKFYREKYRVDSKKSACIPNGIKVPEEEEITQGDQVKVLRKELHVPDGLPVLVSVARLHPQKGHYVFLNALRRLKDEQVPFHALFVGDGPLREELEEKARVLGLSEMMDFLGKRDDVDDILDASDIFVLPSFFEGMSNALLEAMARRKACIVSGIDENKELVTTGKNGLTFIPRDAEDLTQKIKTLLKNPERKTELGERARETIKNHYDIVNVQAALDDFIYEQANHEQ